MEGKEKITLAVSSFNGGGAERVMVTLANKFHDWGYDVDFIVIADKGPYKSLLKHNITKIVLTDENSGWITKRVQAVFRLKKYLSTTNCEAMLSTLKEINVFFSLLRVFSFKKINHFVREADTLDRIFVQGGLKNKFLLYLMRYFYPRSSGVIANCNITKLDLLENINNVENKTTVIYNPLDLNLIRKSISECKSVDRNFPVIVACGRLTMKKNFSDLIKVTASLIKKYPNLTLNILGAGEEESTLKNLVFEMGLEGNINFLGFVDNPYQYYASSNVFVQTSLWEGFGYVLAEAMACGTPVVAYDSKGAMREILADGKYGLLTPVGDLHALADAIVQQIENPTHPEVLQEAVSRFDVDKIAYEYLDALDVNHKVPVYT